MAPKVVPKTTLLEIGETLIFVDSIMIFMVFGGVTGAPKNQKKIVKNHATKKRWPWKEKMQKKCIESDHQGAHRAERERRGDGHGDPVTLIVDPGAGPTPPRRDCALGFLTLLTKNLNSMWEGNYFPESCFPAPP